MDELLTEIEAIVCSGTKLNIDYYIDQAMDEDVVDDIYDYFRNEAQSDSISEAGIRRMDLVSRNTENGANAPGRMIAQRVLRSPRKSETR